MRTTIALDPDVAAAVRDHRRESGLGTSQAVNQLVRQGLIVHTPTRFAQRTMPLGIRIDTDNTAEVLARSTNSMPSSRDSRRHRAS